MNVGIAIRHPEHVHFYEHAIEQLQESDHGVSLYVREFRNTTDLLDAAGLEYNLLAEEASGPVELVAGHVRYEIALFRAARRDSIDVLTSVGGRAVTHIAPVLGVPSVVFADWEPGSGDRVIARLADVVATPSFLRGEFGTSQVVYDGLHELAYLHPRRYHPEPPVRDGGKAEGKTTVVAFSPDATESTWITETLSALRDRGDVLVPDEYPPFEHDAVSGRVTPASAHDVLANADLCVTDMGTVATEAAVLGTPTVFAGTTPPRRCRHLARRYQLVEAVGTDALPDAAVDRLEDDDAGNVWRRRQQVLLDDSEDVTSTIVNCLTTAGET